MNERGPDKKPITAQVVRVIIPENVHPSSITQPATDGRLLPGLPQRKRSYLSVFV